MEVPGLLHRMANLMGMEFHGEVPDEGVVEEVLTEMWKYNQTYQLSQGVRDTLVFCVPYVSEERMAWIWVHYILFLLHCSACTLTEVYLSPYTL